MSTPIPSSIRASLIKLPDYELLDSKQDQLIIATTADLHAVEALLLPPFSAEQTKVHGIVEPKNPLAKSFLITDRYRRIYVYYTAYCTIPVEEVEAKFNIRWAHVTDFYIKWNDLHFTIDGETWHTFEFEQDHEIMDAKRPSEIDDTFKD